MSLLAEGGRGRQWGSVVEGREGGRHIGREGDRGRERECGWERGREGAKEERRGEADQKGRQTEQQQQPHLVALLIPSQDSAHRSACTRVLRHTEARVIASSNGIAGALPGQQKPGRFIDVIKQNSDNSRVGERGRIGAVVGNGHLEGIRGLGLEIERV